MLQACSQAFDVSVFEIFFAWANGMCLCAATNDVLFGDFEQSVRAFEITHLSVTVTVASLLNPENVPSVTFLVTSGEPMTDEVLDKWAQHLYQGTVVVHHPLDFS
jgi:ferricrocin synthase